MKHTTSKRQALVDMLEKQDCAPRDLVRLLNVSPQLVHRYLKELTESGHVEKLGRAPRVRYRMVRRPDPTIRSPLIEKHFIYRDTIGDMYTGAEAFLRWSDGSLKKHSLQEKVSLYEEAVSAVQGNIFSSTEKIRSFSEKTGEKMFLQEAVFAFPYALPDFGKTKESIFLGIAKDNTPQAERYGRQLLSDFLPVLRAYIRDKDIEAVVIVPHSASRDFQIMHSFSRSFGGAFSLPVIPIEKQGGEVPQQQKYLSTDAERLKYADLTFHIPLYEEKFTRVLIIDDMIGSGATVNQIAKKLLHQGIAQEVYGIGIIGTEKGFIVEKRM